MGTRVSPRTTTEGAVESAPPVLGPGARLGRYELIELLAQGGMAQVWTARQTGALGFRKTVALKTIRPDRARDAVFRQMFLDEATLASRIRHANVVEVLDLGIENSIVFLAMPLVEGAALSVLMQSLLPGERIPVGIALRIVVDMLRGLHAAHELRDDEGMRLGLVHRDVSPQNILVGLDGVAKLSDFGIAKAFGRITEETDAGELKGKTRYLAPELLDGLPPSPQSDLFAAGVVLWEALTGCRLFDISNRETGIEARREARVRDPREVADIPDRLAAIALRALSTDPFARYESARQMADEIEQFVRKAGVRQTTQQDLADWVADQLGHVSPDGGPKHEVETATVALTRSDVPPPVTPRRKWRRALVAVGLGLPLGASAFLARSTPAPAPAVFPPPPAIEASNEPAASAASSVASAPSATTTTEPAKRPRKTGRPPQSGGVRSEGASPIFRNPY